MGNFKTKIILMSTCFIILSSLVSCSTIKQKQTFEKEINQKEIEQLMYISGDRFEQIKEYLIEVQKDIDIYYDSDKLTFSNMKNEDVSVDDEFKYSLVQLFKDFGISKISYKYEKKIIKFEIVGINKPKGIIYIDKRNEEELQKLLNIFDRHANIKPNWYYYEEMGHT